MKKTFKLVDLDCANCAAKMEKEIEGIKGVTKASVNFLMQKMMIEAEEEKFDEILKEAIKICKKIEPDCKVIL